MAIAVDSTATSWDAGNSFLDYSHTVSGSNRLLIVTIWLWNGTIGTLTVQYNGTNMTLVSSRATDASGSVRMYQLIAPSTGTNTIHLSNSGGSVQWFSCAVSYTGVDQSTPFPDSPINGQSTGTSFSLASTNTTVDQSWLVAVVRSPSRVPTVSGGTFWRVNPAGSGDSGWVIDSNGGRSTGANTLDYTYSPSQTSYYVITDFAPSAGGGTPANTSHRLGHLTLMGVG